MGQYCFSLKRFIFRNKTTIALAILLITIVTLLSQGPDDSHVEINSFLNKFREQPPYSKVELNNYYKFKLGVKDTNTTDQSQEFCENVWMIAALPGNDIKDYLWEYLSLLAIEEAYGEREGRKMNAFLSLQSIKSLNRIFDSIKYPEINSVPDRCYRLSEAVLIENGNKIFFNENLQLKSLFLLEEKERRYQEIVKTDLMEIRKNVAFNKRFKDMAFMESLDVKTRLEISPESRVEIVGLYIQTLQLPPSYYKNAMQFQRQLHYGAIFMVICPLELIKKCRSTFSHTDTSVVEQSSFELDLAVMSMWNHTIVENEIGILGALLNQNRGDTVMYADAFDSDMEWFSNQMYENVENWYIVA